MMTSLISLTISLYTSLGVYSEIYPSLEGNIDKGKSQYSIFKNIKLDSNYLFLGNVIRN